MWKDVRGGQRPNGRDLNDLARRAEEHTSGGKGTKVARAFGGLLVAAELPEQLFAKITGAPTGSDYPWEEWYYDTGTGWAAVTGGRSGTASMLPAKEVSGSGSVPANTRVALTLDASREFYWFTYEPASGATVSTITVREVDGAPSVAADTIEFDQADGYSVTDEGGGVARLHFTSQLTVEEADGTPSVPNVTTIQFDQATGLVVTDQGGGTARVAVTVSESSPPSWALRVRRADAAVNVVPTFTIICEEQTGLLVTAASPTTAYLRVQHPLPPPAVASAKYERYFWTPSRWYYGGEPNMNSWVAINASAQPALNLLYALPFLSAQGGVVDGIAFWPTTAGGAGKVRLGVYTNESDHYPYPDELVVDSGEFTVAGAGDLKLRVAALDLTLEPFTLYWLVFLCTEFSSSMRIKAVNREQCWSLLGNDDTWATSTAGSGWVHAYTYAALPATFPATAATPTTGMIGDSSSLPAVALRYSAAALGIVFPGLPGGGVGGDVVGPVNPVAPAPQPAPQPVLVNPIALP